MDYQTLSLLSAISSAVSEAETLKAEAAKAKARLSESRERVNAIAKSSLEKYPLL